MTHKFMTDPVRILVKRDELTLEVRAALGEGGGAPSAGLCSLGQLVARALLKPAGGLVCVGNGRAMGGLGLSGCLRCAGRRSSLTLLPSAPVPAPTLPLLPTGCRASSSSLWRWSGRSGSLTRCATSTTPSPSRRRSSSATPSGRCATVLSMLGMMYALCWGAMGWRGDTGTPFTLAGAAAEHRMGEQARLCGQAYFAEVPPATHSFTPPAHHTTHCIVLPPLWAHPPSPTLQHLPIPTPH